jgi:hypothetical protein
MSHSYDLIVDLGLSGFRQPHRFRPEVRSAATSTLIRPPTSELPHVAQLMFVVAGSKINTKSQTSGNFTTAQKQTVYQAPGFGQSRRGGSTTHRSPAARSRRRAQKTTQSQHREAVRAHNRQVALN